MNPLELARDLMLVPVQAASGKPSAARAPGGLPPGRVVDLPGRGETFVRDTGGDGPPVVLLHGWMVTGDANFFRQYDALRSAGFRAVAVDHRGHGRGLRDGTPFRLADAADDVVALVEELGLERPVLVGYSMGGAVTSLALRARPELFAGGVYCATSAAWKDAWQTVAFMVGMPLLRLGLAVAPEVFWGLLAGGGSQHPIARWMRAETSRGSAIDVTEAGRELARYDARPWLSEITVPTAVVVTTEDLHVPPRAQRGLAEGLGARAYEVPGDHFACVTRAREFNAALLAAIRHVSASAAEPLPLTAAG